MPAPPSLCPPPGKIKTLPVKLVRELCPTVPASCLPLRLPRIRHVVDQKYRPPKLRQSLFHDLMNGALSLTSHASASVCTPWVRKASAASSQRSFFRAHNTSVAPISAKPSAIWRPRPSNRLRRSPRGRINRKVVCVHPELPFRTAAATAKVIVNSY